MEFSQLIVDYQRRLRDGYESLQAAEDQTRKLTMEVRLEDMTWVLFLWLACPFAEISCPVS